MERSVKILRSPLIWVYDEGYPYATKSLLYKQDLTPQNSELSDSLCKTN